jgi:beta-glucosidase
MAQYPCGGSAVTHSLLHDHDLAQCSREWRRYKTACLGVLAAAFLGAIVLAQEETPIAAPASPLLYPPSYDDCMRGGKPVVTRKDIYHDGWIDLNKNGRKDIYEDSTQPEEKRLDDLLRQMTLEEKTVQTATLYGYRRVLTDYLPTEAWRTTNLWKDGVANIDEHLNGNPYWKQTPDVPGMAWLWPASRHTWALNEVQRFFIEDTRLGVPAEFTDEGIRGVEHYHATSFPTQLAMGSTWDRALVRKVGEITGREAFVLGYDNVYSPIMDVMRDPRWGRCLESYGEDPYLVSELAIQEVLGIQSQHVVSTMKHFAVYSNNKGAREGDARTDPQIAPREMEMLHLWPYERVIAAAHPLGVMSSYNDYDGIPVTGSSYFLIDILRKRMGFQGYVVSDSDAVEYLFTKHHVASSQKDAVRQVILAGLNVRTNFQPPEKFVLPLRELVREGGVPMAVLDSRVRDVLRVKIREGLFDRPYRTLSDPDSVVRSPQHLETAKQASRESLVLLKNADGLLPLDPAKIKTIALSGPNADNPDHSMGRYGPGDEPAATVRQVLESRLSGKARVLYSLGAEFFDEKYPDTEIFHDPPTPKEQQSIDAAVADARQADIAIVVAGDQFNGVPGMRGTVGESGTRTSIDLSGRQDDLIRAVAATGKPVVVVDISGRPVALNIANRSAAAILQAFLPGQYGGEAIVDALFGDYNPGGKLNCTFPKTTGQLELNFPTHPGANVEKQGKRPPNVSGVLWPFGFGLSYTTFQYANLRVSPTQTTADHDVTVTFDLTNSGTREGEDVPQLYVHQLVSSVITWEQSLRGFDRIHMKPGETRTVSFTLEPSTLAIWNREMKRVVEPGRYEIQIGASSTDIRLRANLDLGPPR